MSKKIDDRIAKQKEELVETLKIYPVVKTACEKVGVGRATYYRWCEEDEIFESASKVAIKKGVLLVNDVAEENLIEKIEDKDLPAIKYWLRHHHESYSRNGYIPVIYAKGNQ